jgi:hypothetical protein
VQIASTLEQMAELAAGIAVTFSEPITALAAWFVAKLRGGDLFDQVMREGEAKAGEPSG